MNKKFYFFILSLFLTLTYFSHAQEKDSTLTDLSIAGKLSNVVEPSIFTISGDAGVEGELYSTTRAIKRRPATTGRVFIRPTFTFLGNFSISFDLFFSTEETRIRQQINRFAIHPQWGWGKAHLGDFNPRFSYYSLNGVNVRGAGLELNPGWFIFEMVGGQSRRAVAADPYTSSYAQYLAGLRLGIGKKRGSFFTINVVGARDDIRSVDQKYFATDSTGKVMSAYPQEDLIVGASTNLKLFNMFRIKGEFNTSLFTDNLYSDVLEINDLPPFVSKLVKLRNSSNLDFAYKGELGFSAGGVNAKVKYSVINPGYRSLGMTNHIRDKRRLGGIFGFRVFSNRVMVQLSYDSQNDNLLKQKLFTTTRKTYTANLMLRPVQSLSIMLSALKNAMQNDATNDTMKIDNRITALRANLLYQFIVFNLNNSITLGYSNQLTETFSFRLPDFNKITIDNFIANWNITISPSLTIGPGFTMVKMKYFNGTTNNTTTGLFRVTHRAFRNRWRNSLAVTYSKSQYTNVLMANLTSHFRLTASDVIKLRIRYSLTNYTDSRYENFQENISYLSIVHRL